MLYKKVLKLEVTEGPSVMDLFTSLAYAYNKANPHYAKLKVKLPRTSSIAQLTPQEQQEQEELFYLASGQFGANSCRLCVRITGIKHEDGTGESFNISGEVLAGNPKRCANGLPLNGHYSTKDRKGRIELTVTLTDEKSSDEW